MIKITITALLLATVVFPSGAVGQKKAVNSLADRYYELSSHP
jgi:hypothetical protein